MHQADKNSFLFIIKNELKEEIFQEIKNEAKQLLFISPEQESHLKEKLKLKLKKLDSIIYSLQKNELFTKKKSNFPVTEKRLPHDSVQIPYISKKILIRSSKNLYLQGYSLNAITRELKISKCTVRNYLIQNGINLRCHSKNNHSEKNEVAPRNAPFGFVLINGSLNEDLKEQSSIKTIIELSQKGFSQGAIARHLNDHQVKPRKALKWNQVTIGVILKRIAKGGTLVERFK